MTDHLYLYGPPGSGKTTVGRLLAEALGLPLADLDDEIESRAGLSIPEIFAEHGEPGFRQLELESLRSVAGRPPAVVALGGGALLAAEARALAESSGQVLCLAGDFETLYSRLAASAETRPLLSGDPQEQLRRLLDTRAQHYAAFPLRLDTSTLELPEAARQAQALFGRFKVTGMGAEYSVSIQPGLLDHLGEALRRERLKGPVALVSDANIYPRYGEQAAESLHAADFTVYHVTIRAGEEFKTIETVQDIWAGFAHAHLDRGSTVVALGGGVVGDLSGFAAATFLRGVAWVNAPTSLLAMVDSSTGGKTGLDLPQGKNLVGAFHAPRLVLADPQTLASLPARELRNGLAEAIKHGIIADPGLFELCAQGEQAVLADLNRLVRRAMAVKIHIIQADPFEKGVRQSLNLGHTVGHGVELASGFSLSHGESVAIGIVAETRLAEDAGIAAKGLAERICSAIRALGLPAEIPAGISRPRIIEAMKLDKKRQDGKVTFAVPEQIGSVVYGVELPGWEEKLFEA